MLNRLKSLEIASKTAGEAEIQYMKQDRPVKCVRCKNWMRWRERWTDKRIYHRRMRFPWASTCTQCYEEITGLSSIDGSVLKR